MSYWRVNGTFNINFAGKREAIDAMTPHNMSRYGLPSPVINLLTTMVHALPEDVGTIQIIASGDSSNCQFQVGAA